MPHTISTAASTATPATSPTSPVAPVATPLSILLKRHRAAGGLTQEALAERAGVSVRTIKNMEQGASRLPRADTLARIAAALQLPPPEEAILRDAAYQQSIAHLDGEGEPDNNRPSERDRFDWPGGREPLTPLIGRERVVEEALALLSQETRRLLTLIGPPGVGKTRIGIAIARRASAGANRLAERVVSVALAPLQQPSLLLVAIAHEMGIHETAGATAQEALVTALRARTTLLFLDNFEHLLAATPDLVALLTRCPNVKALITSRAALRIRAERELVIPPLACSLDDDDDEVSLPTRTEHERRDRSRGSDPNLQLLSRVKRENAPAVELFIQRAQAVVLDLTLDQRNISDIAAICRAVDGLPLAIELAAARARLFSPSALLARLTKRLPVLADHASDLPPRQHTMRDAIAWSYQLLSKREQWVLRRLAVFASGGSLAAAEVICAQEEDAESILDDLTTLVAHSLLDRAEGRDGAPRVTMLETIREFALEQLEREGEHDATMDCHCAYFCSYITSQRAQSQEHGQGFDVRGLEDEYANLRVALEWAIEQRDVESAGQLVAGLWRYWYTQGMLSEGRRWAEAVVALMEDVNQPDEAIAATFNGAGMLAFRQGDCAMANTWLEHSLAICRQLGDQRKVAATLNNLGLVAADQGNFAEAQRLHRESLALKRTLGLPRDIAASLANLGAIFRIQGRYQEAMACYEESLAIQSDAENAAGRAYALGNLGSLAYTLEEYRRAYDCYQECLALQRLASDMQGIAISQLNLAEVAAAQGKLREALALGQESLDRFRAFGEPIRMAAALTLLSSLYREQGDDPQAVAYLRTALDLYRQMGRRRSAHHWLAALAQLAQKHLLQAGAAQLLAASESLRIDEGAAWSPMESRQRKATTRQLRESLGQDTFLTIWDEAGGWSWEVILSRAYDVLAACEGGGAE